MLSSPLQSSLIPDGKALGEVAVDPPAPSSEVVLPAFLRSLENSFITTVAPESIWLFQSSSRSTTTGEVRTDYGIGLFEDMKDDASSPRLPGSKWRGFSSGQPQQRQ